MGIRALRVWKGWESAGARMIGVFPVSLQRDGGCISRWRHLYSPTVFFLKWAFPSFSPQTPGKTQNRVTKTNEPFLTFVPLGLPRLYVSFCLTLSWVEGLFFSNEPPLLFLPRRCSVCCRASFWQGSFVSRGTGGEEKKWCFEHSDLCMEPWKKNTG